jgi:glycosyltransferase involved in cell wall biosynthesis
MKILVAHPVRQHVRWLLGALEQEGILHSFWTLLPDSRMVPPWAHGIIPSLYETLSRNNVSEIPRERIRVLWGPILLQRCLARVSWTWLRELGELIAWRIFDWWVARNLVRINPDIVIGYEMCCVRTFKCAKLLKIPCVLDASACHYRWVDQQLDIRFISKPFSPGRALRLAKQREVRQADWILCPSMLARKTYEQHFVSRNKVLLNPFGYDPTFFYVRPIKDLPIRSEPRFVFVGQLTRHKGLDVLLEAFKRILINYPKATLRIIGPALELTVNSATNVTVLGRLGPDKLASELRRSDCLVLPSRVDSFGIVAVEALAMGLPVIVSSNAGVADVIREDKNGWTVPVADVDALVYRLSKCAKNIEHLRGMSERCQDSVRKLTWSHYQRRCLELFRIIIEGHRVS